MSYYNLSLRLACSYYSRELITSCKSQFPLLLCQFKAFGLHWRRYLNIHILGAYARGLENRALFSTYGISELFCRQCDGPVDFSVISKLNWIVFCKYIVLYSSTNLRNRKSMDINVSLDCALARGIFRDELFTRSAVVVYQFHITLSTVKKLVSFVLLFVFIA